MKIRTDFVTNSSSSSFIVVGKFTKLEDIDLSSGKYLFIGKQLSDGCDVVTIDEEILNYLKKNIKNHWGQQTLDDYYVGIIKCFVQKSLENDNDDSSFSINELKAHVNDDERFEFIKFDRDYHSCKDIEDFKYRYGE